MVSKLNDSQKSASFHKLVLFILYSATLTLLVLLIFNGSSYYSTPVIERPHHVLHDFLKPSGFGGHGLGMIGGLFTLLLLLYVTRKYLRPLQNLGNIRHWLDFHIWLGITGPLLILFHTAFKFGGIVSVAFWSMTAVALSGFFGRYIYLQIPRKISGDELSYAELQALDQEITDRIWGTSEINRDLIDKIQALVGIQTDQKTEGKAKISGWMTDSFRLRLNLFSLRRKLRSRTKLGRDSINELIKQIKELHLLKRRMVFLKTAQRILHHWHIIHRPFAMVMYIILVVHVTVAFLFGYRWIF